MLDSKTYDILKEIGQLWIPMIGTLVTAIMAALNIPYAEVTGAIFLAVDSAVNTVVTYYKKKYDAAEENSGDVNE